MRRVLYAVILLAMLVIPASSAFAQEDGVCPFADPNPDGWWLLGEVWWTPDWVADPGGWDPDCGNWDSYARVDTWMTRFSTLEGWPLSQAPIMGDWWWTGPASEQRRMSFEFAGDDYKYANVWGGYYSQFMLPRDEVWFPCSYPYKWKCNYALAPGVYEVHSPAVTVTDFCLLPGCTDPWPWFFADGTQATMYDTISPVQIDIFDASLLPVGYSFELEIAGYFWKYSDLKEPWYPIIMP